MHLLQSSFLCPQPSVDHCRDQSSPEKRAISTRSPSGEEANGEQRTFPAAQLTIREEGSPPASAKVGTEAGTPAGQGTRCLQHWGQSSS